MTPRLATSLIFFLNGFVLGNWASRIPVFIDQAGLNGTGMGRMIFLFGIGAVTMMITTGFLCTRFGTVIVCRLSSLLLVPSMLALGFISGPFSAALFMPVFGCLIGALDVSMNASAVKVERNYGHPILSSCHGFWSFGAFIGAIFGGMILTLWGASIHILLVSAIAAFLVITVWRKLENRQQGKEDEEERTKFVWPRGISVWLLGLMALLTMEPEGAVMDWSAAYMHEERSANPFVASLPFAVFVCSLTLMQLCGDRLRERFGNAVILRISAIVAFTGMAIGGLAPYAYINIIGFALCGIGGANIVPILISTAGNLPDTPSASAVSIVTSCGYSGLLFAPFMIGHIAQYYSYATVYSFLALCFAAVFILSFITGNAIRRKENTS